jgi:putative holliday junction resolvase
MRRLMGLDVGDKTVGVAVSDELGFTAQGVCTLRRQSWAKDLAELGRLALEKNVRLLVVGLPLNMDGSEGPRAKISRQFAERASEELGIAHALWDERLSTAEVRRVLIAADVSRQKRKEVVDMLAAQVILQGYLEAHPVDSETAR